jgi:hypothetical protein
MELARSIEVHSHIVARGRFDLDSTKGLSSHSNQVVPRVL